MAEKSTIYRVSIQLADRLLAALVAGAGRNMHGSLTRTEGILYLNDGDRNLTTTRQPIAD